MFLSLTLNLIHSFSSFRRCLVTIMTTVAMKIDDRKNKNFIVVDETNDANETNETKMKLLLLTKQQKKKKK